MFSPGWFGRAAEQFARFFGTPTFLIGQTVITVVWMVASAIGWTRFDPYPFILLNFAYTVQSGYAAPLILLAQTRQADRDKVQAENDRLHREEIAEISAQAHARILALVERLSK